MPPKKAKKTIKAPYIGYSDEDSDFEQRPRKSRKPLIQSTSQFDNDDEELGDKDIYDDDDRQYMKLANEVVMKNVNLPVLFDPNLLPGFSKLINDSTKISADSRVLEASYKVYGKRVDVTHTEVKKVNLDISARSKEEEKQKKRLSQKHEETLNEPTKSNEPSFSGDEDEATMTMKKQKENELMNAHMTQENFDEDTSISPSATLSSYLDNSFKDDDLRTNLMRIAKDRTVLMGNKRRTTKEIEERLKRANADGMDFYKNNLIRHGCNKKMKVETNNETDTTKDYSFFQNSFYQYAMSKKRENRHVCIDDVAASTIDGSRIYMHYEWGDEEDDADPLPATDENEKINGPDVGDFLFYPDTIGTKESKEDDYDLDMDDDVDIIDGVLEHFQGTLEFSTANTAVFENEFIDTFGLEKKDLRPSREIDVSFEQTANDDFDPDKRLVDRLVIEGEDEAMKAEEDRIEALVKELYSDRFPLSGGPGNPNEDSIRRQMNYPLLVKMYQDEDVFFPLDQTKYVTSESMNSRIAVSRSYFIKHTKIKTSEQFGISNELLKTLRNFDLPTIPLSADIVKFIETLPSHIFTKELFTHTISKYDYNESCHLLSSCITPFRMARYCQRLITSVIHEVQSTNLPPEFFTSFTQHSRANYSQYSIATPTPRKKARYDETFFNSETYRYFAALELEKKQRYPNQIFNNDDDTQIYKVVSTSLSSERGASTFLPERIKLYFSPQCLYNFFAYTKFFVDNCDKDFSTVKLIKELPRDIELNDFSEDLALIERNTIDHEMFLDNTENIPAIAATDTSTPMEIDNVFDNDFDYHDAPSSPFKDNNDAVAPQASQSQRPNLESQDIFAGSVNDNGGAYEDADDYGENLFNPDAQLQPEGITAATLDDSLVMVIRGSDVEPIVSTRLKRNAKKIQFVDDDAHWEKPAGTTRKSKKKKTAAREELQEQHDDSLLFAPRPRTPSASSSSIVEESPRISRCQDSSLPSTITDPKFSYRLELGQTIPGYGNSDIMFFPVRFSEHITEAFPSTCVLYRGKYSYLPPFSRTRQEDEYLFGLRTIRVCEELTEAKKAELNTRKSTEGAAAAPITDNANDMDYDGVTDNDYHDPIDNDFDALDGPSSSVTPPTHSQPRISTQFVGSLMSEYQQYHDDEDSDEEIDDFDFESNRDKDVTLHHTEGKFALKRAIKYILTKPRYDRSTLPDEISGIKVPPPQITDELVQTQILSHSTPIAMKKSRKFQFEIDEDVEDEVIGGDNLLNGSDVDEESDYENDSDETRMKDFKIDGFHTLKSLLFYLPDVCHPDTVRILSVAHVFCTLCHMANENNLRLIQEYIELDGGESTSDCRILNLEDTEDTHDAEGMNIDRLENFDDEVDSE